MNEKTKENIAYIVVGKNTSRPQNPNFLKNAEYFDGVNDNDKAMFLSLLKNSIEKVSHTLPYFHIKEANSIIGIIENTSPSKERAKENLDDSPLNHDDLKFYAESENNNKIFRVTFSSSISEDNPLSLIKEIKCHANNYREFKGLAEKPIIDAIYSKDVSDENIKSHEGMNENTEGMFKKNIPSHLRNYISYEGYENLTSKENLEPLQNNRLLEFEERNIKFYNKMISKIYESGEMYNEDEKYSDVIDEIIENYAIESKFSHKDKCFVPPLTREDIDIFDYYKIIKELIFKNLPIINADIAVEQSCKFRELSGIPFTYSKDDNSEIFKSDNFFASHPENTERVNKLLWGKGKILNKIKEDFEKLNEDYDNENSNTTDTEYKNSVDKLTMRMAREISEITNIINEIPGGLFCGMAVSDVFSSVISQHIGLLDIEGNLIDLNTAKLTDEVRNPVFNNDDPDIRREEYAELVYSLKGHGPEGGQGGDTTDHNDNEMNGPG